MQVVKHWIALAMGVASVSAVAVVPSVAQAASASCMTVDGSCDVSNDGFDSISCECNDGSAGGGGGGNAWAGLTEDELQGVCFEELMAFCGPPMPPTGIQCDGMNGTCWIDNEPSDSLICECNDGSGGFQGGGNEWAGLSDDELLNECEANVDVVCGPPIPVLWDCETDAGACDLEAGDDPYYVCECADGSGSAGSGQASWNDLDDRGFYNACLEQIESDCGGVATTASSESSSSDGGTTDPTGAEGSTGDTASGSEGGSSESGSEGGSSGGTEGGSSTGAEGGDVSASASASATDSASASASDSATAGNDESSTGDTAGETSEGSGCACNANGDRSPLTAALALLGLVGLRRRRR